MRTADRVPDPSISGEHRPPPRPTGPQAQVRILAVHEEAGVEPAECIPGRSGDCQQATGHDRHLPDHLAGAPGWHRLRVQSPVSGRGRGQAGGEAEPTPQTGLAPAGIQLHAAIRTSVLSTDQAGPGPIGQGVGEGVSPAISERVCAVGTVTQTWSAPMLRRLCKDRSCWMWPPSLATSSAVI